MSTNKLFAEVELVKYKQDRMLRLAELKENKRTGEKRYKLIVNDAEVSVGVNACMGVGDIFVAEAYNFLMLMEMPGVMGKRISKKTLMKYEYILNSGDSAQIGVSFQELSKAYGF